MNIDNAGLHDSLLSAALARLTDTEYARVLGEVDAFIAGLHEMHAAERRGVSVAPAHRRPLLDQLRAEARRRETLGDRSAAVWSALAESMALQEAVEQMANDIA